MTYGTKQLKNGKMRGYFVFDTGKRIVLSTSERAEFQEKINYWNQCALEKRDEGKGRYIPLFDRRGGSGAHNCMKSAFCEVCGLDVSEK